MRQDPWDVEIKLPWEKIKDVWDRYWDQDKPLLVEKSPPNIIRTNAIAEHFSPVYFLLMVRNPYALCEGLIRRNNLKARDAAEFTVRCLKQQAENVEKLDNILCFTYEELVANPESISRKIQSFIPQIGELKYTQRFKVHSIDGRIERGIVDLNTKKIQNLSVNQLKQINSVLRENSNLMNYWGYEYYEPSLHHMFTFINTRTSLLVSRALSKGGKGAARIAKRVTSHFT